MSTLGVDLSSHNGVPDMAALRQAGYLFVVLKVTGGDQYANPPFQQQYAAALAAGMHIGLYHYDAEPTVHTGTADQEASWFLQHLPGALPKGVFLALDAEEAATRDPTRYRRWLDLVAASTNREPLFYSYPDFLARDPAVNWGDISSVADLWFADYAADEPAAPAPWRPEQLVIWQRSGGSPVPGSPVPADVDVLECSFDDLARLTVVADAADSPAACGPYNQPLGGGFAQTWHTAPDAVTRWGYPITAEMTEEIGGESLTVQYFERARFEYNHQTGLITFGRIGVELARARGYTEVR